eukprot:446050_1
MLSEDATDIENEDVNQQFIQTNTDNSNESNKYTKEMQVVLSQSIKTVNCIIVVALFSSFSYTTRQSIWYLYAREFDDSSEKGIASVLWLGFFSLAIVGLFYPCLGDVIGYDKAIMIKLIIRAIGIFGECIAMNFAFLSVFYILSQAHLFAVALAHIAWILPHEYAVQYTGYLYAYWVGVYCLGPPIAGMLVMFISYRAVFWVNFVFNILIAIFSIKYIYNTQTKQEIDQLALKEEFSKHKITKELTFPIINHSGKDRSDFKAFWSSLSTVQWIQLINIITQYSLTTTIEVLMSTFYAVFIIDYFSQNVLYATSQLFAFAFGSALGCLVITILNKKYKLKNKIHYLNVMSSAIILIFLYFIVLPMIINVHLFWLINVFFGFFVGSITISQETVILQKQPTQHAGKIGGIKSFIFNIMPAIAMLYTGLLYSNHVQYAFGYVSAGCSAVVLCLLTILFICKRFE